MMESLGQAPANSSQLWQTASETLNGPSGRRRMLNRMDKNLRYSGGLRHSRHLRTAYRRMTGRGKKKKKKGPVKFRKMAIKKKRTKKLGIGMKRMNISASRARQRKKIKDIFAI